MKSMEVLREKIWSIVGNMEQVEAICLAFEDCSRSEDEERKIKQMEGIKKAREEGKQLGRPKIREPEDFISIAKTWERKEITAHEAAVRCGMGTSTFYRRVRAYRDDMNYESGRR